MDEYGPQTEEIKKFLERVRNLTPEQAGELDAAWNADKKTAKKAVWDAAWSAAWNALYALDAAWSAARTAVWDAHVAVPDAVWDAVLALVVKDQVSEEVFDFLYGPWKSVMEK